MKRIRQRIAILGLAAACWGVMFPEYTFTADSYAEIAESGEAAGGGERIDARDICRAAREGKVRYRFRLYDFLREQVLSDVGGRIYE